MFDDFDTQVSPEETREYQEYMMRNMHPEALVASGWREDNDCWLDGEPAKIVGWQERFATVASVSKSFEWSWKAVANVMAKNRQFKS